MGIIASLPWKPINGHSYSHVMGNIRCYEKAFSARYEAAYMWFFVQSVKKELNGKGTQKNWQLDQRKWNSYNQTLKEGALYVLTKKYRSKWKRRYCVLQPDYSLHIYKSKEEYENGLKPRMIRKHSGFLVTGDVDGHIHEQLTIASRDFGYVNPDINAFAKRVTLIGVAGERPTQHIFLVDHPWRGTTYFAADTAIEKDEWMIVLQDSVRHLAGCQCEEEVAREAFSFAVEQSVRLKEFYVDLSMLSGTQEEILTDLISAFQSVDCKKVVLPRITGDIVNKYKAWNFVLTSIHDIIHGVVTKQYLTWKKDWEEKCDSKRQKIIDNLPKINEAYQTTSLVIREALAECFDPVLKNDIIPRLGEIVNVMSDSLVSPLRATRQLFKSLVEGVQREATNSPQFANNLDQYFVTHLDFSPRNPEFTCPTGEVPSRGSNLRVVAFLQTIFPNTDFHLHLSNVYNYQQQLLDSAVCTFESLCGDLVNNNEEKVLPVEAIGKIEESVLKKLDYDILLAQKRFFREILLSATMERARESIEQCCKPKMLDFEASIPEQLRCYLPINNVFTDVLTKRFGELVNPVLTSCMRRIGNDVVSVYASGNGKRRSNTSFASIIAEDDLFVIPEIDSPSRRNSDGEVVQTPIIPAPKSPPVAADDETERSASLQPLSYTSIPQIAPSFTNGCGGGMDDETGEWYPTPAPCSCTGSRDVAENGRNSDDSSSSGSGDDSERLSQQVAREFLDSCYRSENGAVGMPSDCSRASPTTNEPCAVLAVTEALLNRKDGARLTNGSARTASCNGAPSRGETEHASKHAPKT